MRAASIALHTAAGALAGCVALALLEVLYRLTTESAEPLAWNYAVAYAVTGALVGLVCGALSKDARPAAGTVRTAAIAIAAMYAPLVFDRAYDSLRYRSGSTFLGVLAASAVVAAYLAGLVALRRIARPRATSQALLFGAAAAVVALVLDRNVFGSAFRPIALASDAALGLAAVAGALLTRASRPRRLAAAVLVGLGLVGSVSLASRRSTHETTPPTARTRPPDLVLVVIDTLRADVFDSIVRDTEEGRAFHRAVGDAAWFSQATSVAPWTLPAMGSIMTGRYPPEHGLERMRDTPLDMLWSTPLVDSVPTLAERLQTAGYLTEAIGTNHFLNPKLTHIDRGFARYGILENDVWRFPLFRAMEALGIYSTESPYKDAATVRQRLARRLEAVGASDRPLFLWVHLMDPHSPLEPRSDLTSDPAGGALPELERMYRDASRHALAEVAKMVEDLKAAGRWSNAIFVVTADHGEMLPSDDQHPWVRYPDGSPRAYGHGHALTDTLLRIPLVIRPPGGTGEEHHIDVLANQVDLHATMCELVGIECEKHDSISFAPWLASKEAIPVLRTATIAGSVAYGPDQRALRAPDEKLIVFPGGEHPDELYDLTADPLERNNLATQQPQRLADAASSLSQRWPEAAERATAQLAPVDEGTRERLRALGYAE